MVANRSEPTRPGGDPGKGSPPPAEAPAKEAVVETPKTSSGGLAGWVPLLAAIVLMPALAYVMTAFVIVPKLERAVGKESAAPAASSAPAAKASAHGEKSAAKEPKKKGAHAESAGKKVSVPLKKVLVNVSGTQGTRFLLVNMTLAGNAEELKTAVEENMDQLSDLASSSLSTKTIADLEKPGARNLIRAELLSVFNSVLGSEAVNEIYFTEFAIQ
jgi:flagellar protein FliL